MTYNLRAIASNLANYIRPILLFMIRPFLSSASLWAKQRDRSQGSGLRAEAAAWPLVGGKEGDWMAVRTSHTK